MTREQITQELADCKSTNRYVRDFKNDRFWVFGVPAEEILVRRVENGFLKPLRTMPYSEIAWIEPN